MLEGRHVVVQHGKVVREVLGRSPDGTVLYGEPLDDYAPIVQAALALLRVNESRRKLTGADSPAKLDVDLGSVVRYTVVGMPEGAL